MVLLRTVVIRSKSTSPDARLASQTTEGQHLSLLQSGTALEPLFGRLTGECPRQASCVTTPGP